MVGRKPRMTAAQMAAIREWNNARRAIGTPKQIAATLGLDVRKVRAAVTHLNGGRRMYKRELE